MSTCRDFNTPKGCQRSPCRFAHKVKEGVATAVPKLVESPKKPGPTSPPSRGAAVKPADKAKKVPPTSPRNSSSVTTGSIPGNGRSKQAATVRSTQEPAGPAPPLKGGIATAKGTQNSKSSSKKPAPIPPGASNTAKVTSRKPPATAQQLTSPPGTCRLFYNFGKCTKSEKCRFRHVAQEKSAINGGAAAKGRFNKPTTPFVADDGNMSGVEALRHLAKYCTGDVAFTKPFQIVAFVKLLTAAEPRKRYWDAQDAQLFLETLTEGQGLSRLEYILTYPAVVPCVGSQRDAISFTSAYLGCLSYFVDGSVLSRRSPARMKLLYGVLHTHFGRFYENVTVCMQDIVSRRSFEDPPRKPASGDSIFNTLILVLIGYLKHMKTASRENHTSLLTLEKEIIQWFDAWKSGGFVDGWVPANDHARMITIDRLKMHLTDISLTLRQDSAAISVQETSSSPHRSFGQGFSSRTLMHSAKRTLPRYRPFRSYLYDD